MDTRLAILSTLHDEPGLSLPEIRKEMQCSRKKLKYHLSLLLDDEYVVHKQSGNRFRITASGERELRRCRISSEIGFDT